MKTGRCSLVPVCIVAGAILMLPSSLAAQPEEKPVSLMSQGGGPFSMYSAPDKWMQRIVVLRNDSNEARLVKITFSEEDVDRGKLTFSRILLAQPNAIRRVYIPIRSGRRHPLTAEQEAARNPAGFQKKRVGRKIQESLILWDVATGQRLDSGVRTPAELDPNALAVAHLVGKREDADTRRFLIDVLHHPRKSSGDKFRWMRALRDRLPDRWYGYSVTDGVILDGLDLTDVRASQIDALLDWVRRGGVLVLPGTPGLAAILRGPVGRAAGTSVLGHHRVTSLAVTDCVGRRPPTDPVALHWPAPMFELVPDTAEVLYETDCLPLVVKSRHGRGQIFTFAVPIGALSDPKLHFVWACVSKAWRTRQEFNLDSFAVPARESLKGIAGRRAPSRRGPLLLFGVLTGATILGLGLLMLKRRGEIVWVALVPIAIACGVVLWWQGQARADKEQLSYVGVLSSIGSDSARAQCLFAYYSGPDKREGLDYSSAGNRSVVRSIARITETTFSQEDTLDRGAMLLPDQTVQPQDLVGFGVEGVIPTKGLSADLKFGPKGLQGPITNHMGAAISPAVLYANRRTWRLGDLPAGGAAEVVVGRDQRIGSVRFSRQIVRRARRRGPRKRPARRQIRQTRPRTQTTRPARLRPPGSSKAIVRGPAHLEGFDVEECNFIGFDTLSDDHVARNKLLGQLLTRPRIGRSVARGPLLVGWMQDSPMDPLPGRDLDRRGWCAVIWPLTFAPSPPGARVSIPEGLVNISFARRGLKLWNEIEEQFIRSSIGGPLHFYASPPPGVNQIEKATARLTVTVEGLGYQMEIWGGLDQAAEGQPKGQRIKLIDAPAGKFTIDVPDADRFRQSDGRYVFTIRMTRAKSKGAATPPPAAVASKKPPGARRKRPIKMPAAAAGGGDEIMTWMLKGIDVSLEGITRDSQQQ